MHHPATLAVLISGRGSNLKSLLDSAAHYSLRLVISDKTDAAGLAFAHESGVPVHCLDRRDYSSKDSFRSALYEPLRKAHFDIIALAGFMQIVPKELVTELEGRLINIHPSLLPAYPGLHTHERAIESGERYHGCTVHFVDAGVDTGPIIAQAKVPISRDDTPDTLAARVLHYEHRLYPWVANSMARRLIRLEKGRVHFEKQALAEAAEREFIIQPG